MELKTTIEFVTAACCKCGIPFAFPDYTYRKLKDTGDTFYCPNGHGQIYTVSTVDKLKQQISSLQETKDWYQNRWLDERTEHKDTKNSLRATKAAKTRLKNRIKNGVCPCCNRHFANVQRHIETKHPDYSLVD